MPMLDLHPRDRGDEAPPAPPRPPVAKTPSFPLGQTVITPSALAALAERGIPPVQFLARHAQGDWGDLTPEDRRRNQEALRDGARLLSSYQVAVDLRIWVITEADRSSTCVLLPEDY